MSSESSPSWDSLSLLGVEVVSEGAEARSPDSSRSPHILSDCRRGWDDEFELSFGGFLQERESIRLAK